MTATATLDSFDALLEAARQQPERQRLLLVFAKAMLPKDATEAEANRFEAGQGGGLVPIMCVDKGAEEITGFDGLVEESRQMGKDWDMVLVACLAGRQGRDPSAETVDEALKKMVGLLRVGGSLDRFATFDQNGEPVRFE